MLEAILAGLFGLLIGSFLNVCIYRLPRDLSVVRPRSFCPQCNQQIAWFDNVPVLTYLLLRGRCRHCGKQISWRYPLVEFLTGSLFFAAVAMLGPVPAAWKLCFFCAIQVALIFTDLEERILPDEFTVGGAVAGVVLAPFVYVSPGFVSLLYPDLLPRWASLAEACVGSLFTAGVLWSVGALYKAIRRREGLGLGDVKMMAMIGAFLGLQGALLTILIGSVAGSILGLLFIMVSGKDSAYELPFGSFLGAAAIVVAFLQLGAGA